MHKRFALSRSSPWLLLWMLGCAEADSQPKLHGPQSLTLLHTSDLHSQVFERRERVGKGDASLGLGPSGAIVHLGGFSRLATQLERERARSLRSLYLDSGDCTQGHPVFSAFGGEVELEALGALGLAAMSLSNHELDRGSAALARLLHRHPSFPLLACNYRFEGREGAGEASLRAQVLPFSRLEVQGLRVGVLGAGNMSSLPQLREQPNELAILPLESSEAVQAALDVLRPSVDLLVLLSHLGFEADRALIARTTGLDVVLGGHDHRTTPGGVRVRDCSAHYDPLRRGFEVRSPGVAGEEREGARGGSDRRPCRPRDVLLVHSGALSRYLGRIELRLSDRPEDFPPGTFDGTQGFEVASAQVTLLPLSEPVPEAPSMRAWLEPYRRRLDPSGRLDEVIAYAPEGVFRAELTSPSSARGDSALGNLVTSALRAGLGGATMASAQKGSEDRAGGAIALLNSTGLRAELLPGPITPLDLYGVLPFDDRLVSLLLRKMQVESLLEAASSRASDQGCRSPLQVAGMRVELGCGGQPHGRVLEPLPLPEVLEVATSAYVARGLGWLEPLRTPMQRLDTAWNLRDVLEAHLRSGTPCGAVDGRLRSCRNDADCAGAGAGGLQQVCACTDPRSCQGGVCLLQACLADFAPDRGFAGAAALCATLPCVDSSLGALVEGRIVLSGR